MFDTLKKIGVPTAIATIIVVTVMMVPFLFKIDERYAKHHDMKESIEKLRAENNTLRHELAQLVGFQQAMAALIQSGKVVVQPTVFDDNTFSSFMIKVQDVTKTPVPASAPASAASAPVVVKPKPPARALEKPSSWRELNEGLYRQQQRLMKD